MPSFSWFFFTRSQELNDVYVVQLEVSLARATKVGPKDFDDSLPSYDGTVPLHFYGELVKTPEGRMILAAKGHFEEFAIYIRRHGMEAEDQETIAKLKSTLWAVVSRHRPQGRCHRMLLMLGPPPYRVTSGQHLAGSHFWRTKGSSSTSRTLPAIPRH